MRQLLSQLVRSLRQLVGLDHTVARPSGDEARMLEKGTMEAQQRRWAIDHELLERAEHPQAGPDPGDLVDYELPGHRVAECRDIVARPYPLDHTYAPGAVQPL